MAAFGEVEQNEDALDEWDDLYDFLDELDLDVEVELWYH